MKLEVPILPRHVEKLVTMSFGLHPLGKLIKLCSGKVSFLRKMSRENEKADSNFGEMWNNYLHG